MKVNPKQLNFLDISILHQYVPTTQNRWKCEHCEIIRSNEEMNHINDVGNTFVHKGFYSLQDADKTILFNETCNQKKLKRIKK